MLKREHFEQLGRGLELTEKQIKNIFDRMTKNKPKAINWINNSFLSNEMKKAYIDLLDKRYKQLLLS